MTTLTKGNAMRTILLKGNITTVEPFNVTKPDITGIPLDTKGNPMIPASTIRGALRHAAHNAITILFAEKLDKHLDVDTHYLLASGVDTGRVLGNKSQATKVGEIAELRDKHPMLSLWGAWGIAGKFSIGSAVAQSSDALIKIAGGSRQHVFKRNEDLHEFVDESQLDLLSDILVADAFSAEAVGALKVQKKELQKQARTVDTKEEKAEIREQIAAIDAQVREAKDSRVGASESIQRPLESIEAIDKGIELPHRMTIKNPTDNELNLALWNIGMLSLEPFLGGHTNHNFGEVKAKWDVYERSLQKMTPVKIGEVGFDDDGFFCSVEGFDFDKVTQDILNGTINIGSIVDDTDTKK